MSDIAVEVDTDDELFYECEVGNDDVHNNDDQLLHDLMTSDTSEADVLLTWGDVIDSYGNGLRRYMIEFGMLFHYENEIKHENDNKRKTIENDNNIVDLSTDDDHISVEQMESLHRKRRRLIEEQQPALVVPAVRSSL